MKKAEFKKVLIVFLGLVIFVVVIRFLLTPEDGWFCHNGVWVRHGNPAVNIPTGNCP